MTAMNAIRRSVLGMACGVLGACAMGNSHTFNYVPTEKSEIGRGRVVLLFAVDDRRPYVVDGDERPNFVGEQRNGYGMPFNVTTSDGRPFSAIVQETLQRDLEATGFRVTATGLKPVDVAAAARTANANRLISVVMTEFKSDTYTNINVDYDFEAIVYDSSGKELARNRVSGEDVIPGSMMNPPKAAKAKVPAHFYTKIHRLVVQDAKMMSALTSSE